MQISKEPQPTCQQFYIPIGTGGIPYSRKEEYELVRYTSEIFRAILQGSTLQQGWQSV